MSNHTPESPPEQPDADSGQRVRDPRQVMRDRAAATRKQRDDSIAQLRESMDDEEILDEFGINLDGIES